MGKFKKFLAEYVDFSPSLEWVFESNIKDYGGGYHMHEFDVEGHNVKVHYAPRTDHSGTKVQHKRWHVDFEVNQHFHQDAHQKSQHPSASSSQKIMQGVAGSVHHFIRSQKPKSIHMKGNSDQKDNLYSQFAHHLSKVYKARVNTKRDTPIAVHFKHADRSAN